VDIVALLLRARASVNLYDKNNTTPLIWASRQGMSQLLNLHHCMTIIPLDNTEIVDLLLKHNASINNIGMKNMTALLAATKNRHADSALRLLENRAIDIQIQDKVSEMIDHVLLNFERNYLIRMDKQH